MYFGYMILGIVVSFLLSFSSSKKAVKPFSFKYFFSKFSNISEIIVMIILGLLFIQNFEDIKGILFNWLSDEFSIHLTSLQISNELLLFGIGLIFRSLIRYLRNFVVKKNKEINGDSEGEYGE